MVNRIIQFSLKRKLIIVLATLSIAAFGFYAILKIPVGAVPDITNNQVQVITTSTNLSTQDIEQFITTPIELEMSNLPGVKEMRSISKFGLSVVTIVFDDKLGTYLPRQLIAEKIKSASAKIPAGFGEPDMGPITTGLGEIYQYILDTKPGYKNKYSPMELRTIQDWVVKRQLSGIPGVVEVNTWGGYLKQYEIAVNPERLRALDLTLRDVFSAIQRNNHVAGGAYIEKEHQSYFIRGDGLAKSISDLESIVVAQRGSQPILVKDVATVGFGHANRFGAITANGEGEKVLGQIMMLKNANSLEVIKEVKQRVEAIQKNLPQGVFINPILERSELLHKTTTTVAENLILGCIIVFLTVLLLLGNIRTSLVIASVIPLSLLFTISAMYLLGIDANLMSLGALDFGIIIDGAVIIVEYIVILLSIKKRELDDSKGELTPALLDDVTYEGSSQMMRSAIFGQIIILIVFIPILSLSGIEGKMFRPMALSFGFAIIGAMLLGLTWIPVAASLFLRPDNQSESSLSKRVNRFIYKLFRPTFEWSFNHKKIVIVGCLLLLASSGILFSRMGGEFVPTLDEGDYVIQPVLKTGTSLSQTIETTTRMEQILKQKFPEVDQIVSRIGAAEVPTDPMSMEEIDMIIKLKPKKEWKSARTKEELAEKFEAALSVLPGIELEFTQPIEMRFNELITGVRADLAIKVFGEDLNILAQKANEIKRLIEHVPGAQDIIVEKTEGLPQMAVHYNRERLAYYGLNIEEVNQQLAMAFGGEVAGSIFEGERRFDMVVRLDSFYRKGIEDIQSLTIALPNNQLIPLTEIATTELTQGPAKISRDNTHRRVFVSVNARGRDLQSIVTDIKSILDKQLKLPAGYYVEYGGQFKNLEMAKNRLKIAVPIALLLIFIFLHFAFKSMREAMLIFTSVPLSAVGGVFALWIRGMPFSISAGVGFIALFGVAVLNGIVLIEYLKELKKEGITDIKERIFRATKERLRPVVLTASAAALGFLPMAVATSAGAEVQRPLATVVIGGLITSTLLTLIALPILYSILESNPSFKIWKRRAKKVGGTTIILLLMAGTAQAQPQKLTIEQALEQAYRNNKKLEAYELKIEEKRAISSSAISFEKANVYHSYDQSNLAENGHPLKVFGVEQSFSFPTAYAAQYNVGKKGVDIATSERDRIKLELTKSVMKAYYNTLYTQSKIELVKRMEDVYARLVSTTSKALQHGAVSKTELLNAQSKYNLLIIRKKQLERDRAIALSSLKALMQVDEAIELAPQPLLPLPINEQQLGSNPDYQLLQHIASEQKAISRLVKNLLLPDINIGYFVGTNQFENAKRYQGFQIGVGIPLLFYGQRSKIRASNIAYNAALSMQENYQTSYYAKINECKEGLAKYKEAIDYYQATGKDISKELTEAAYKSFDSGEIDIFRLMQSIENALEIESTYLDNLYEYNNMVLDINFPTL